MQHTAEKSQLLRSKTRQKSLCLKSGISKKKKKKKSGDRIVSIYKATALNYRKKNDASDNVELTYVAPVISTADHV